MWMSTRVFCLVGLGLPIAGAVSAQNPPADSSQSASFPSAPASNSNASERLVSWKRIIPNILDDQKRIWLFPAHLAEGSHLVPVAGVLGATAALVALDPVEARYFRDTRSFHAFNQSLPSYATTAGILVVPAALYFTGILRKDSKAQQTALLAAEAVADAEIPNLFLRNTTRRLRPADVPLHGNFSDTWFDSGGNPLKAQGSFPSGHTAAAFAVATVIARRYHTHRWVPLVAYGVAGAIGLSRISLTTHFSSDVFFGGALGYSVGRFVVLRQ
jgi:membrane-associated phospholipid phosphatase